MWRLVKKKMLETADTFQVLFHNVFVCQHYIFMYFSITTIYILYSVSFQSHIQMYMHMYTNVNVDLEQINGNISNSVVHYTTYCRMYNIICDYF